MLLYSLSSLIVFSTVVKLRSFSKAADLLCMSQPGVSNHVTQLETQVGLKLINRERGAFGLTKEGKIVFRYARQIDAIARDLEDKFRTLRKDSLPLLRIGTTVNYARKIMPHLLGGFNKNSPHIKIKLNSGSSVEVEKALLSGQDDVTIAAYPHTSKKIASFPFVKEQLVLIAALNHPLAHEQTVSLADIRSYPFIIREDGSATRSVVLNAFSKMNIIPSVLIEANNTEFIKEWVSQEKGVSILIERSIDDEDSAYLKTIPLIEPLFLEVSVAYLKSKKHDPSVEAFIRYVKEITESPDSACALQR
jgi:DNA-binding transcriptional LysR family regulator